MIDLRDAVALLHDEAHADDKVQFALCTRQTCRDLRAALDYGFDPYYGHAGRW